MYGDIGQKSNTMIFNDRPADVNALMAQAGSVLQAGSAGSTGNAAAGIANSIANVAPK